jgi:hypothetical protein
MGRTTWILVTLGAIAVLSAAALAQDAGKGASPPTPPRPAPDLAQLKYFAGSFHCTGRAFDSPFGPAHPTEADVTVELELDGFWYTGRYMEKKTRENPHPYEMDFSWGYDGAARRFTAGAHDNLGGVSTESSAGWSGDTLVWQGDSVAMGKKGGMRDTFTKKGPDTVIHLGEMESGGGWIKLDEETCTRVSSKKV